MADSTAIDEALTAKLSEDSTLMGLMTDGVCWDVGDSGRSKFIVLSLVDEDDEPMQGGRSFEDAVYLVKAVHRAATTATVKAAAARIDALLDNGTLTVSGYSHMLTRRLKRIKYVETDDVDKDIRWQHRGGHYQIVVSA